jgi:enoyl-CoA hydratase/carnithine racemase
MSDVKLDVEDGIALVTLDRPEALNALHIPGTLDELARVFEEVGSNPAIRALVLTGAGRAFCAGADMHTSENATELSRTLEEVGHHVGRKLFWPLAALAKPSVCAVNGAAVGAGAELTLQCDVRIASTAARLGWVFVHRSLVPGLGVGTYLLPRIIGLDRALEVLLSGKIYDAAESLQLGLVREVVEPGQLVERAIAKADEMSRGAPLATRWVKQLVYASLERDVDAHLEATRFLFELSFRPEDNAEGARSFFEKRAPRWSGR